MGRLVEGVWQDVWYDTKETKGHFKRSASQFRNWITADGEPGPSGKGGFKAEKDRYHLYVSLACPWAHRTLIFRKLKKLDDYISVSVVDPLMLENGWEFKPEGSARRARRRIISSVRRSSGRSTPRPIRTIPAASPCPFFGTSSRTPSSPMSRRRSSACSTAPSMR